MIYLDAPAEVLLARKGEGTIEALARRRQDYLSLATITASFEVVDATRPLDEVTAEVIALIRSFARAAHADRPRRRGPLMSEPASEPTSTGLLGAPAPSGHWCPATTGTVDRGAHACRGMHQ